jgi:hypothetical protein
MSEVEYDSLLDAVRMAVAPASRKNQTPAAANEDHVAGPVISFPADW